MHNHRLPCWHIKTTEHCFAQGRCSVIRDSVSNTLNMNVFTRTRVRWWMLILLSFVGLWVSSMTVRANTCVHAAPTAAHTKVLKSWLHGARQHKQRHTKTRMHTRTHFV